MKPVVAVVGGFLGAGKTTLILKAARLLASQSRRVAVVMNDQGSDLVDAELARRSGIDAESVTGGCFCCRFPDLVESLERLRRHQPEVIFAEAVGSCVDLVATTLLPLLRDYAGDYRIAPLTVLVHETPVDPDLRFLFDHQVAEADLVVTRDVDVGQWVDDLLLKPAPAATAKLQEFDYQRYAAAEAALVWLNARLAVNPPAAVSPAMVLGPWFDGLERELTESGVRIVHLKAIVHSDTGYVKAAITANGQEPAVEGALDASPAPHHEIVVNLRALGGTPDQLGEIVTRTAASIDGARCEALRTFHPAAPVPHFRL